jgi:hypothetical protein
MRVAEKALRTGENRTPVVIKAPCWIGSVDRVKMTDVSGVFDADHHGKRKQEIQRGSFRGMHKEAHT